MNGYCDVAKTMLSRLVGGGSSAGFHCHCVDHHQVEGPNWCRIIEGGMQ